VSLPLTIRPEAERDLEEAAAWYEQQRGGLGCEFLDRVQEALRAIAEQPRLYPVVHRHARRALARRFPFGIYYVMEHERIVVVAVMHGSRDPRRWQTRA